jgi:NitT/TauT family transport system substrate-binding protein
VFFLAVSSFVFIGAFKLAAAPLRVKVAYPVISPIMGGIWMAKEIGAFEKYGLQCDLVYIASGPVVISSLLAGELNLAFAATNAALSSIHKGAPLVAVGAITSSPGWSLWAQPEITKLEQLEGKVIGVTSPGGAAHFLTLYVLTKFGLQDKVRIQAFRGEPARLAAFREGLISGMLTSLQPAPRARQLLDLANFGIPYPVDLIVVKRDFHESSAKTVEAALKAYMEGVAALRSRKDQAMRALEKYLRRPVSPEEYQYPVKYLSPNPKVDPKSVRFVLDWIGAKDAAANSFFDNTILDRLSQEGFVDRLSR